MLISHLDTKNNDTILLNIVIKNICMHICVEERSRNGTECSNKAPKAYRCQTGYGVRCQRTGRICWNGYVFIVLKKYSSIYMKGC